MEADHNVEQLEASGPASDELATTAWKTVEHWKGLASMSGVEFSDFRCFQGGCAVTSTHRDLAAASSAGQAVFRSDPRTSWRGGMFRSGPLRDGSGKIQLVWILYTKQRH
jgi:hypothetical protein